MKPQKTFIKVTIETSNGSGKSEVYGISEDLGTMIEVIEQAIYACGFRFMGSLDFQETESTT